MKIAVIGGTGLIGTKVVTQLRRQGHQVIAASPATGINTITGEGLAEAFTNADVVIDLSNSPSFEERAAIEFFQTSGRNILSTALKAGVKHHVVLSIVGVDTMEGIPYMQAKKVQEDLIRQAGVPYTIIRSTQFFEFLKGIADQATKGNEVHLSDAKFQPIAADDVAGLVVKFALAGPANNVIEIACPERFIMYEVVAQYLMSLNDPRKVISTGRPEYLGGEITHTALLPSGGAELGAISFEKWLHNQSQE